MSAGAMSNDGAATAAGFYLGVVDDVTPKLAKMERRYLRFMTNIIRGNERVQKSIGKFTGLIPQSGQAATQAGGAGAGGIADVVKRFTLSLEPKRGLGLIRRLFPSAREYQQKFTGRLVPLAKGGMVKDPTAALIGEGGEPEAVIPLSKMQGFFSRTLSAAVRSAGSQTNAAGGKFRKSSDIRDIIVAFTDSEKQIRQMVQFLNEGVGSGRDAAQDAHRMASVIASMREGMFADSLDKARFVSTLKKELTPAVEKMRKQADLMGKTFERNDELIEQAKQNARDLHIQLTAMFHNLSEGIDYLEKLSDIAGNQESRKSIIQTGGVSRRELVGIEATLQGMSGLVVSTHDLLEVASGAAKAGVRGAGTIQTFTENFGKTITEFAKSTGAEIDDTAVLFYHLNSRMGMSIAATNEFGAGLSRLSKDNAVTFSHLNDRVLESGQLMQGVFHRLPIDARQRLLDGMTAATAAFGDQFQDVNINALVKQLATDVSARSMVGAQIGMTESQVTGALTSGNFESILPGILGSIKSQLAGKTGTSLQVSAGVLNTQFGGAFGDMDPETLASLANNADAIGVAFKKNNAYMGQGVRNLDAMTASAESAIGPMGMLGNALKWTMDKTGVSSFLTILNEFDFIKIGQGILGFAVAGGALASMIGTLMPGLGGLMTKLPFVGKIFAKTGKDVGEGAGKMAGAIGTGLGTAISGVFRGVAVGLSALAAPQVALGSLVFIGIAGGVWILGHALKAAAPFVKETLGGAVNLITALGGLDISKLLLIGPALSMIGVGFAAMGLGIGAGMLAMVGGNLVDKLSSFFGLSQGEGFIGVLNALVATLVPLAAAYTSIAALPSEIPLPTLTAPDVEAFKASAESAQLMLNEALAAQGGDKESAIVMLLTRIAVAVEKMAGSPSNRPSPGGLIGELLGGGRI